MPTLMVIGWAGAWILFILLIAGGIKLSLHHQTRGRGILMLVVAAAILVMNVMIWTV